MKVFLKSKITTTILSITMIEMNKMITLSYVTIKIIALVPLQVDLTPILIKMEHMTILKNEVTNLNKRISSATMTNLKIITNKVWLTVNTTTRILMKVKEI